MFFPVRGVTVATQREMSENGRKVTKRIFDDALSLAEKLSQGLQLVWLNEGNLEEKIRFILRNNVF